MTQRNGFQITTTPLAVNIVAVVKPRRPGPIRGVVKNTGPGAFTFHCQQSSDGGGTDAYSNLSMHLTEGATQSGATADAATVVVNPGGVVRFTILPSATPEAWVRFTVDELKGAIGTLNVAADFAYDVPGGAGIQF